MEKLITSPVVNTKIKKACITDGTIVVFPDEKFGDYELSLDTIKTLFGEQAFITKDCYLNRGCIVINNANFFIVNSESMGADVELELKVNDPL